MLQTYVEALKKEGNFGKDAQLIALNTAKDIVLSQLSEDIKNYINTNFVMSTLGLPPKLRQA